MFVGAISVPMFVTGCGGSSKNTGTPAANLHFNILWPTLSRKSTVNAPAAARSVLIRFEGATAASSFTEVVNRPSATAFEANNNSNIVQEYVSQNRIDLSSAVSSALGFRVGEATLRLTFYSDLDGNGSIVAVADAGKIVIKPDSDGKPNGGRPLTQDGKSEIVFKVEGKITGLDIPGQQEITAGIRKDLSVVAIGTSPNERIALAPGVVRLDVESGDAVALPSSVVRGAGEKRDVLVGIQPAGSGDGSALVRATLIDDASKTTTGTVKVKQPVKVTVNDTDGTDDKVSTPDVIIGESRQFSVSVQNTTNTNTASSAVRWRVASKSGNDVLDDAIAAALNTTSGLFDAHSIPTGEVGSPLYLLLTSGVTITLEATSELAWDNADNTVSAKQFGYDRSVLNPTPPQPATTTPGSITFKLVRQRSLARATVGSIEIDKATPPPISASAPGLPSPVSVAVRLSDKSAVDWSVDEADGGTLSASSFNQTSGENTVTYTAPLRTGTFTVRATSRLDRTLSFPIKVTVDARTVTATID